MKFEFISDTLRTVLVLRVPFFCRRSNRARDTHSISVFNGEENSSEDLRLYLSKIEEQCDGGDGRVPSVVILDNLHHVSNLTDAFTGFLSHKATNWYVSHFLSLAPLAFSPPLSHLLLSLPCPPPSLSLSLISVRLITPCTFTFSPYIIGTMSQTSNATTNLQLHHNFRWVLCANHMEPVKGFLGRYLRRRLVSSEVKDNTLNNDLSKVRLFLVPVSQLKLGVVSPCTLYPQLPLAGFI